MKFPPCGLRYGDIRDQELTKKEGNKPFLIFWLVVVPIFLVGLLFIS